MSGKWLTVIAVAGCFALVGLALWQRSRTTMQVRAFWGASQARLIQHAPIVHMRTGPQADWQDVSQAPGLVHLRATLVDDRYFQWEQQSQAKSTDEVPYSLRFQEGGQQVELAIAPGTGMVTYLQQDKSVPLIPASAQAISAYLKTIQTPH